MPALERMLEGDSENWIPVIFRGKKGSPSLARLAHTLTYFGRWRHSHGTRPISIERRRFCWNLLRSIQEVPTQNRPANSLRTIFLAWRPQTYASLTERIAVVRRICLARPEAGFRLSLSLLPTAHGRHLRHLKAQIGGPWRRSENSDHSGRNGRLPIGPMLTLRSVSAGRPGALPRKPFIESLAGLEPESREQAIISIRRAAGAASGGGQVRSPGQSCAYLRSATEDFKDAGLGPT